MHGTRGGTAPPPTLAQRAFPRRVRLLLEGVLEYASDELERGLAATLNEQEQQLFKLAEQARSNDVQSRCFEALREIKRSRPDVIPRFLISLEAALARISEPPARVGGLFGTSPSTSPMVASQLSLVEDGEMDESGVLTEIANRAEVRNSLVLFLLGQRFGVVAGRPAFDAETLPVGPHALCRSLREAVSCMELNLENRLALYRQFDRLVMQRSGSFYEALNTYLAKQNVLPHLTFVPIRARPTAQDEPARSTAEASRPPAGGSRGDPRRATTDAASVALGNMGDARGASEYHLPRGEAPRGAPADQRGDDPLLAVSGKARPYTGWPGMPADAAARAQVQHDEEIFDALRQLLSGRRSLLGKLGGGNRGVASRPDALVATDKDLQGVLGTLQTRAPAPVMVEGRPAARTIQQVKQDLLAQLRQVSPGPNPPVLAEEDADTIDLVGMLFDNLMKDVKANSPAAALLTRMQVPLLRVALRDKGFFTRQQHPARQMLNTIAETGAFWSADEEADGAVVQKMQSLVDRVTGEFDGDLSLFDSLLEGLSGHVQTVVRKAEVAERRHVEAARGKEKLELSRIKAAETMDGLLAGKRVPKFLNTLLCQAWTDVLALTLLRQGESETWRSHLRLAERLVEAAVAKRTTGETLIGPTELQTLRSDIEEALAQVGYHAEDAQAVATRLVSISLDEEEVDPASRTELAMRLKSHVRFGQNIAAHAPDGEKLAPLKPEEAAHLEEIRALPFGTWFEFVTNQQGDRVRRRMSWYSTVTGHCLFVNHRGQRIGEYSLNWLARELHRGNVRVVHASQGSLIDRAWENIVGALRSFGSRGHGTRHAGSEA